LGSYQGEWKFAGGWQKKMVSLVVMDKWKEIVDMIQI
jgi:hypothetical protein